MVFIRSLAFDAIFYSTMAVFGIVLAPAALLSRSLALRIVRIYLRCILSILGRVCGLRTEVRGAVPRGEVLVASKHQSFLDVLILQAVLDRPRFVMKKELRHAPVFGWYARRLGCIVIDRGAGRRALEGLVASARKLRGRLGQLVVYPQGTRVAPGARRPYRAGVAAVLAATDLACVPAATNAGVFWGRNSLLRKPGLAVVEFLPPLPPGLGQEAALRSIERDIEAATRRLEKEAAAGPAGTR